MHPPKHIFAQIVALLLIACISANAAACKVLTNVALDASLPILEITFDLDKGAVIYATSISFTFPEGLATDKLQSPPEDLDEYTGKVLFRYAVPPQQFAFSVTYQVCSETMCYMPATLYFTFNGTDTIHQSAEPPKAQKSSTIDDFTLRATASGYLNSRQFLEFCDRAEVHQKINTNILEYTFYRFGLLIALLLLIPLGAVLNLTPCVLPLIPINLAIIGATGADRQAILRKSLLYSAGMAVTYGAIGAVTVISGAAFGSITATPAFNFTVAVIFLILALSQFDVFSMDMSRWRKRAKAGSPAGIFLLGGVTAILASACVAPVLIWAIVLAMSLYAGGEIRAMLLPFFLGIGMALPWPFIALGIGRLPKPGAWMIRVRQSLGLVILLFATFYVATGIKCLRQYTSAKEGWMTDINEAVKLSSEKNTALLIEFTGKSCKSCTLMDNTTFRDKDVNEKLKEFTKLEVNMDNKDNDTSALVSKFKIIGAPSFVILKK